MDSREFVRGLLGEMDSLFSQLGDRAILEAEAEGEVDVIKLLKLALKSEIEASEIAALWLPSTPEIDAKIALSLQCSDEMKHYQLISDRLAELGEDLAGFEPLSEGHSPLYQYLRSLRTTVERIAAGPFASEAIAKVRNAQFVDFCRSIGDEKTALLYDEVIQPEEAHHHDLGREILEKYATTPELQEMAAAATRNTLAIADELRDLAAKTTGIHSIPVS